MKSLKYILPLPCNPPRIYSASSSSTTSSSPLPIAKTGEDSCPWWSGGNAIRKQSLTLKDNENDKA